MEMTHGFQEAKAGNDINYISNDNAKVTLRDKI
jgi:hypothetical protein